MSAADVSRRDPHEDAPRPPRRRWRRALLVLATLAIALPLLVRWLLQPAQLTPFVLDRTGDALGLVITAERSEVRLRGEPQLVVHALDVREAGAKTALLQAGRVVFALPWSTLRSRGRDLVVTRVELDAPTLDVPALQTWLAKRPPSGETRIPTVTDGLRIDAGRIVNDDWRIDDIAVRLPALQPGRPLRGSVRGRYLDAPTAIPFDLAVAMTRPGNDAGVAVLGTLTVERGDWRLPAYVKLSGPLHLGEDEVTMTPARLGVSARYVSGDTMLPFALGLYGPLRFDEATWTLAPAGMALRGEPPLPSFDAHGTLALGRRLALSLDGTLPTWPEGWPVLPAPLSSTRAPLPFALRYDGAPDLSAVTSLALRRDATRFDGRFHLYDVLGWIDHVGGAPLPPLDGTLHAPRLDISGATLEGVEISLDDETIPSP